MTYKTEIINRINNSEKWPAFSRPAFLDELNIVADEAFSKGSIEGYLTSILIYQQLSEEMIKLLLECCDFLIRLAVFPHEIQFRRNGKRMFGQLIDDLENTLSFKNKITFIQKCRELNEVRNRMVHKLTLKSSLADIKRQSLKIKEIFDAIHHLYDDIYDEFRVSFKDFKKDVDWDEWLEEIDKDEVKI